MFTSGFAETDTEEGSSLQNAIIDIAKTNGLIVIGPNCMGVYNSICSTKSMFIYFSKLSNFR